MLRLQRRHPLLLLLPFPPPPLLTPLRLLQLLLLLLLLLPPLHLLPRNPLPQLLLRLSPHQLLLLPQLQKLLHHLSHPSLPVHHLRSLPAQTVNTRVSLSAESPLLRTAQKFAPPSPLRSLFLSDPFPIAALHGRLLFVVDSSKKLIVF